MDEIRPFPHQPDVSAFSDEGRDLGVPAIVFPQWLRCTGCNLLAPLSRFEYRNTHPYRPDEARFEHVGCPGFGKGNKGGGKRRSLALPARYLLACTNGHLDEFPYDRWVHRGGTCPDAEVPHLKMLESTAGRGASATIECASCGSKRGMNEAQGAQGKAKLPACRGRFPHLDAFVSGGCDAQAHLMLIGASNLWFPILQSVIVMPMDAGERKQDFADQLRVVLGDKLAPVRGQPRGDPRAPGDGQHAHRPRLGRQPARGSGSRARVQDTGRQPRGTQRLVTDRPAGPRVALPQAGRGRRASRRRGQWAHGEQPADLLRDAAPDHPCARRREAP